jgi:hypothetical protein
LRYSGAATQDDRKTYALGKAGEAYAGKFTRKIQGLRAQNSGPLRPARGGGEK